ncbi:MAG TPA: S-layer homology domain-containing protein, partial [Tissierellaceae bacterium]
NVNINNITIEDTYKNSMYADSLINLYDIENLKVRDLNFKNNVLSIIAMDNVNYDIEDVNISIDKDFDKIIELLNKEDLEYEKLLIQYGLRDYMYSYEEDNDSKYSSIRNVDVNLSNENVDRYWLNLELEGRQLNIDRFNLKNSSNVISQTCFHAFESDIKATNMKLGDKNLMTPLLLEMEESELDLTNNTIINYEVGSNEFIGAEYELLYFDNFDEKLIKINNNILDIVKSKDLENDDCECYENLVSDIQFNNNILLNLKEEELKNNSKDNIFIDDYKELNFLDDNFKLKKDSLAVDKGNNSFLDTDIFTKDVIGNNRLYNGKIDIGAYEYNKVKERPEEPEIPNKPETPEENDNNTGNGSNNGKPQIGDNNSNLNKLEKKDHFAYIKGYEDKTIRPNDEITREEVAMVFYRLLDSDYRERIEINKNNFKDMSNTRWSNKAVSTLVNGDIIKGYPNNEFRPNANITRAEVAAIASRFDNLEKADNNFLDISKHWAEEYIKSASKKGWVKGYLDRTFRPDKNMTRGEFISLVNNVLERK